MNEKSSFFQAVRELNLSRSTGGLKFYLDNLFEETNLKDKRILDIGAGSGVFSCYMALAGAKEVIGLEPEMEGSRNNYISKFQQLKDKLNITNVTLKPLTFQDFNGEGEEFDIILLHHSINHLNENACIALAKSPAAREEYKKIFQKLLSLSSKEGIIIIADCSCKNVFPALGIKNIFTPTIEWHKHQTPELWSHIMEKTGYKVFKTKWVSPSQLGRAGNFFLGNKICSFFIHSHFIIYARKND